MSILLAVWPFGAIIGSVVGGFLATYSLTLPIILSSIPLILSILLAFFIEEPKYHKAQHKNVFKQIIVSSKSILSNKQIVLIILAGLIMMAFGESAHELKPIFLDYKLIPIQYFGIIFGFTFALSFIGHYFSHYTSEKIGNKNMLIFTALVFPFLLFLATISSGLLSMVFLVLTGLAFGLRNPVISHMLNIEVKSSKRATVLSINNFFEKLGITIGGLYLGYLADIYNINTSFKIGAILMVLAAVLFLFLKEKN